jgi:hypothetical protein
VHVQPASETKAGAAAERTQRQEEERERRQCLTAAKDRQAVLKALKRFQAGETARIIREASRLNSGRFTPVISELEDQGVVVGCEVTKAKGTYPGLRLADTWWDKVGQGGTTPTVPLSNDDGGTRDPYRGSQSHLIIFGGDGDGHASVPVSVPQSDPPNDWDEQDGFR